MIDAPLVPGPVYGLRTWRVVKDGGRELLAGPHRDAPWPPGAWLEARCASDPRHVAPAAGCECGIHAWHPRRESARRVLATRFEVPGVVEARGAVEVHADGLRVEAARPYALVLLPGRNGAQVRRLAATYGAEVVELDGAEALEDFCRERGLGLGEPVVADLLGPVLAAEARSGRRRSRRTGALRMALAVVVAGILALLGAVLATDPPGPRTLHGRSGEIHVR